MRAFTGEFSTKYLKWATALGVAAMLFTLTSGPARAQEQCKAILKHGVWEVSGSSNATRTANAFLGWFCSQEFASQKQLSETGVSLGIPVDGLPVDFGFKGSNGGETMSYEEACRMDRGSFVHASAFENYIRRASPIIVGAWQQCISSQQPGLFAWIETSEDPTAFTLEMNYKPLVASQPGITVSAEIAPKSVSCGLNLRGGTRIEGRGHTICHRKSAHDSVIISLRTQPAITSNLPSLRLAALPLLSAPPQPKPIKAVYLSDLPEVEAENIHGGLGKDKPYWQDSLTIDGTNYPKGLVVHPGPAGSAKVTYKIPRGYTLFSAIAGFADQRVNGKLDCVGAGHARFRILLDGTLVREGQITYGHTDPQVISLNNARTLTIETDNYDGTNYCDHVAFGDAVLH